MCLVDGLYQLRVLLLALVTVLKRQTCSVPPLLILSAREVLLYLIQNYSRKYLDSNKCQDSWARMTEIRYVVKNIRANGIEHVSCYSNALLRVLCELVEDYDHVEPLDATHHKTFITYDRSLTYRTLVADEDASGPIVGLETSVLSAHDLAASSDCRLLLSQKLLSEFRRSQSYRYNRGMFFGPTTRTTRAVCFKLANGLLDQRGCECVYVKENKLSVITAPVVFEPVTQELRLCTDEELIPDANLEIICEEVPLNESRTRVSLAAATRCYETIHGLKVMHVDWIDTGCISNDRLYTATDVCPRPLKKGFPYDRQSQYRVWHVVMGNGCRIEVRTTMSESMSCRRFEMHPRWTLVNADEHPDFDECAYILQRYYELQARGGIVSPLNYSTIYAFAAAGDLVNTSVTWLVSASLQHPATINTPVKLTTNRHTTQFVHAMVIKHLTLYGDVVYDRLDAICCERDITRASVS